MVDATISAGTRSALFALSSMQNQISVMENRLATGKKVNAPIDNANSYFLSAGLSSRANAINGLMSDITNTQGSIAAANNGIAAIRALLTTAQTIANQARQFDESPVVKVTGSHSTGFAPTSTIASTAGSASRLKAGDTVTVGDGTTTATYAAANGDTIQTLLDAVNNTGGLNVTAALSGGGQLQFTATSAANITIGGSLAGAGHGTLYGILGLDVGTAYNTANTARANLATQFDDVLSRINEVAADAGFQWRELPHRFFEQDQFQRDRNIEPRHQRLAGHIQRARSCRQHQPLRIQHRRRHRREQHLGRAELAEKQSRQPSGRCRQSCRPAWTSTSR
jgi:hypothetical protein